MKINRAKFIRHLERLSCSGQCTEVVFNGAFAARALTPDHRLLITAPGLDDVEQLDKEIGVADLGLLTKALKLLPGEGNTGVEVDVYVEDNRLVIDDGARGVQRLLIAAPKTIATRVEAETAEMITAAVGDGVMTVPLTKGLLDGVSAAFSLYKAAEVEIHVTPKSSKIVVGTEKTHRAEFEMSSKKSREEFVLLYGQHLVDAFRVITDFSTAEIVFGGDARPILINDGEFSYLLGPSSRSADDKPAVKKEKTAPVADEEAPAAKKPAAKKAAAKKAK